MQSEASSILSITSLASGVSTIAFNQLYDLIITTQKNIGLAGNLFALIPALGSFFVNGLFFDILSSILSNSSPENNNLNITSIPHKKQAFLDAHMLKKCV